MKFSFSIRALDCLVTIIFMSVKSSIQHYIPHSADACYLAKLCNHNWIPEIGKEKNSSIIKLFLDECDRYEYNCDNKKNYEKVERNPDINTIKKNTATKAVLITNYTVLITNSTNATNSTGKLTTNTTEPAITPKEVTATMKQTTSTKKPTETTTTATKLKTNTTASITNMTYTTNNIKSNSESVNPTFMVATNKSINENCSRTGRYQYRIKNKKLKSIHIAASLTYAKLPTRKIMSSTKSVNINKIPETTGFTTTKKSTIITSYSTIGIKEIITKSPTTQKFVSLPIYSNVTSKVSKNMEAITTTNTLPTSTLTLSKNMLATFRNAQVTETLPENETSTVTAKATIFVPKFTMTELLSDVMKIKSDNISLQISYSDMTEPFHKTNSFVTLHPFKSKEKLAVTESFVHKCVDTNHVSTSTESSTKTATYYQLTELSTSSKHLNQTSKETKMTTKVKKIMISKVENSTKMLEKKQPFDITPAAFKTKTQIVSKHPNTLISLTSLPTSINKMEIKAVTKVSTINVSHASNILNGNETQPSMAFSNAQEATLQRITIKNESSSIKSINPTTSSAKSKLLNTSATLITIKALDILTQQRSSVFISKLPVLSNSTLTWLTTKPMSTSGTEIVTQMFSKIGNTKRKEGFDRATSKSMRLIEALTATEIFNTTQIKTSVEVPTVKLLASKKLFHSTAPQPKFSEMLISTAVQEADEMLTTTQTNIINKPFIKPDSLKVTKSLSASEADLIKTMAKTAAITVNSTITLLTTKPLNPPAIQTSSNIIEEIGNSKVKEENNIILPVATTKSVNLNETLAKTKVLNKYQLKTSVAVPLITVKLFNTTMIKPNTKIQMEIQSKNFSKVLSTTLIHEKNYVSDETQKVTTNKPSLKSDSSKVTKSLFVPVALTKTVTKSATQISISKPKPYISVTQTTAEMTTKNRNSKKEELSNATLLTAVTKSTQPNETFATSELPNTTKVQSMKMLLENMKLYNTTTTPKVEAKTAIQFTYFSTVDSSEIQEPDDLIETTPNVNKPSMNSDLFKVTMSLPESKIVLNETDTKTPTTVSMSISDLNSSALTPTAPTNTSQIKIETSTLMESPGSTKVFQVAESKNTSKSLNVSEFFTTIQLLNMTQENTTVNLELIPETVNSRSALLTTKLPNPLDIQITTKMSAEIRNSKGKEENYAILPQVASTLKYLDKTVATTKLQNTAQEQSSVEVPLTSVNKYTNFLEVLNSSVTPEKEEVSEIEPTVIINESLTKSDSSKVSKSLSASEAVLNETVSKKATTPTTVSPDTSQNKIETNTLIESPVIAKVFNISKSSITSKSLNTSEFYTTIEVLNKTRANLELLVPETTKSTTALLTTKQLHPPPIQIATEMSVKIRNSKAKEENYEAFFPVTSTLKYLDETVATTKLQNTAQEQSSIEVPLTSIETLNTTTIVKSEIETTIKCINFLEVLNSSVKPEKGETFETKPTIMTNKSSKKSDLSTLSKSRSATEASLNKTVTETATPMSTPISKLYYLQTTTTASADTSQIKIETSTLMEGPASTKVFNMSESSVTSKSQSATEAILNETVTETATPMSTPISKPYYLQTITTALADTSQIKIETSTLIEGPASTKVFNISESSVTSKSLNTSDFFPTMELFMTQANTRENLELLELETANSTTALLEPMNTSAKQITIEMSVDIQNSKTKEENYVSLAPATSMVETQAVTDFMNASHVQTEMEVLTIEPLTSMKTPTIMQKLKTVKQAPTTLKSIMSNVVKSKPGNLIKTTKASKFTKSPAMTSKIVKKSPITTRYMNPKMTITIKKQNVIKKPITKAVTKIIDNVKKKRLQRYKNTKSQIVTRKKKTIKKRPKKPKVDIKLKVSAATKKVKTFKNISSKAKFSLSKASKKKKKRNKKKGGNTAKFHSKKKRKLKKKKYTKGTKAVKVSITATKTKTITNALTTVKYQKRKITVVTKKPNTNKYQITTKTNIFVITKTKKAISKKNKKFKNVPIRMKSHKQKTISAISNQYTKKKLSTRITTNISKLVKPLAVSKKSITLKKERSAKSRKMNQPVSLVTIQTLAANESRHSTLALATEASSTTAITRKGMLALTNEPSSLQTSKTSEVLASTSTLNIKGAEVATESSALTKTQNYTAALATNNFPNTTKMPKETFTLFKNSNLTKVLNVKKRTIVVTPSLGTIEIQAATRMSPLTEIRNDAENMVGSVPKSNKSIDILLSINNITSTNSFSIKKNLATSKIQIKAADTGTSTPVEITTKTQKSLDDLNSSPFLFKLNHANSTKMTAELQTVANASFGKIMSLSILNKITPTSKLLSTEGLTLAKILAKNNMTLSTISQNEALNLSSGTNSLSSMTPTVAKDTLKIKKSLPTTLTLATITRDVTNITSKANVSKTLDLQSVLNTALTIKVPTKAEKIEQIIRNGTIISIQSTETEGSARNTLSTSVKAPTVSKTIFMTTIPNKTAEIKIIKNSMIAAKIEHFVGNVTSAAQTLSFNNIVERATAENTPRTNKISTIADAKFAIKITNTTSEEHSIKDSSISSSSRLSFTAMIPTVVNGSFTVIAPNTHKTITTKQALYSQKDRLNAEKIKIVLTRTSSKEIKHQDLFSTSKLSKSTKEINSIPGEAQISATADLKSLSKSSTLIQELALAENPTIEEAYLSSSIATVPLILSLMDTVKQEKTVAQAFSKRLKMIENMPNIQVETVRKLTAANVHIPQTSVKLVNTKVAIRTTQAAIITVTESTVTTSVPAFKKGLLRSWSETGNAFLKKGFLLFDLLYPKSFF